MKKLMVAFLMIATWIARADIPHPKTVDFDATYAPDLECFQANEKTWQWTVRMAASKANLTGYTGVMYIARSTGQGQPVVIAGCSVQNASNGIFNAKFSPTDLNTNGSFIYGVGISSGKVTIARQGKIAIYPDPYASGTPITWTNAPVNLSLYTFLGNLLMGGTITAGSFVGDGSGLTGIGGAVTNGLAAILYVDAATNALRGELVPLIPSTNGLVGASITNGLVGPSVTNGLVGPSVTNGLAGASITNGLESIAGSVAKTNALYKDIAAGVNFTNTPTVNGNSVSTNTGGAGAETDPVYTTGLTARLSGIIGTAAYSNGADFVHASRIGELTNETFFRIYTNNATWYGTEQVTVTPTNEFLIDQGFITNYIGSRTHVVIPHEIGGYVIEEVSVDAFKNNDTIVSVVFPDATYMKVNEGAFSLCDNLEFVTFNGIVDVIATSAFESCPKLVSVRFKKATQPADNGIYTGSTHVTNYVSTDTYDWGPTFSGRPVVIPPLSTYRLEVNNTNVMEMVTSNTDAIAINTAAIGVNSNAITAATNLALWKSGGTATGAILTTRQSGWESNELVSASFVRSLFSGGSYLYNITNVNPVNTNYFIASSETNSVPVMRLYTAVTNNQYVGGIMTTSRYTTVNSPVTISAYIAFQTGAGRAVSIKPEIYYSYDGTNLLGDYDTGAQAISSASTNPSLYTFVVSFPTINSTNSEGFYLIRKFKVTSQNNTPNVYIWGNGAPTLSTLGFNTPPSFDVSLGVRGATNATMNGTIQSYDTATRVLALNENDPVLRARTNSAPSDIEAPAIRTYVRGKLYSTNALVMMSRSTSQGHAWYQVGWVTNSTSPFVAVDGFHLASTTNQSATLTNSIPPETFLAISVTNLGTVTSNLFVNIGYVEP